MFKLGELVYVPHFKEFGTIVKIWELDNGDGPEIVYRTKMEKSKGLKDQDWCLDWRERYLEKPTKLSRVLK